VPDTAKLPGLGRPVRVLRDRFGIPHLLAGSREDAYRALGYTMARDRLWQMDLMRRLGGGRVAEVLGGPFLAVDALARTVGFPVAAQAAERELHGAPAALIAAFADGVTAWIDSGGSTAPEFELLGYVPEPWRPIDSLLIEYFVGFALSMESLEPKLLLARALGRLGIERGSWLYPCALPDAANDPERLAAYRELEGWLVELLAMLAPPPGGSNAWAVAPRRAAGGAALVSGDPHLLHAAPSPWYLVHLVAPDLDVAGAAYVGGPLIQVGRNRRGAWSVTNLTADDLDLVVERLHPEDPGKYAVETGWEPLVVREESIPVRGDSPARLVVRSTRNGPLLGGVAEALGIPPGAPLALKWKSIVAPGHSGTGWIAVNQSRGLADVLAAGPGFDGAPFASNFIYGDAEGHLAHLALGAMPRRARPEIGMLPALGWRGEGAWEGIGSLGATPWRVDPEEGAVWTANEQTGAADRAAGGSGQPFGEHPARARRIRGVLCEADGHTVGAFAALQTDDLDLAARDNLVAVRNALDGWDAGDALVIRARDLLLGWDARCTVDSPAAAVYHVVFYAEWVPLLFPEESCPGLARRWRIATWGAERVLRAARSPWFADPPAKAAAIRGCVSRAVARLRGLLGDDPDGWRWGALHSVRFLHPLAFAPRFAKGVLPAFPIGGSPFTVNQQRFGSALPPFGAVVGAGVRMVVDLADPDHFHVTLSTGESGDPESLHFADHLPRWQAGELLCVELDPERLVDADELVLAPRAG
jgi:penicillin amidase